MTVEKPMETMRALLFDRPAQALTLNNSWPVPKPDFGNDEHLLKVHSIAITNGELTWPFPPECYEDYSPGVEMSGRVIASPPGSKFPPGSEVYMRTTSPRSGSAREYTIGLGKELAFRPQNLTAEQAASVPVSALTAWQALFVYAGYSPLPNDPQPHSTPDRRPKILIIGASGGVGLWTTQLAHAAGFSVTGTCHTRNTAIVQASGAHSVIDYTKTSVREYLKVNNETGTFDLVVDCFSVDVAADAWYAAHPDHGQVIALGPRKDMDSLVDMKWTLDRPEDVSDKVTGRFFIMSADGDQLQRITELIEAGTVKPVVDSVFDLDRYTDAFERAQSGQATGKVVVKIQS